MKCWYLGCKAPYTSQKTSKTYYQGQIAQVVNHGGSGMMSQDFETDERTYAKMRGLDPFQAIDIDARIEISVFNGNQRAKLIVTEVSPL